jgi:hypothetical protein
MGFVVKVTFRGGSVCWLAATTAAGIHTLGPRERAEVFRTQAAAHAAIAKVPRSLESAGVIFSIEPAE